MPLVKAGLLGGLLLGAWAGLLAGCVSPYLPPTAEQPHATLKVRRVYEKTAGTRLHEMWSVKGHPALEKVAPVELAGAPRADGFLVYPTPARIDAKSAFDHTEVQTVQEPYTEEVSYYETESYSCGSSDSYSTCTRGVTRYRSETKYRWVTKSVDVIDSECSRSFYIAPATGHVYLVDFTYRDSGACSAKCIEQISAGAEGTFDSRPCPTPTPMEIKTLEDDD
jgi:hypothetical protein